MKAATLTLLIALFAIAGYAQPKLTTYTSQPFRITNYGEYQQSSTGSPTVVTLNLEANTISIESESSLITNFVEGNMTQTTAGARGGRKGTQTIATDAGFLFTFDAYARKILITKQGTNIRMHALWLDEVSF